jgi:glycosyltransferase involved in cell wall biosynthesis
MPKISIIVVCYNAGAALEDTIKNVLGFQHGQIDFIIIDGKSTDGSMEVIKKYAGELEYWVSESDEGIYDAMNKGWELANPDSFVLYLGAGDKLLSLPDEKTLNLNNIYFGDAESGDNKIFTAKKDIRLKFGNTLHHQSLLIPKQLHEAPPFNKNYKVYADFDFNQRLLKSKVKFIKLDDLVSYFAPDGFSQHYKTFEWFTIIRTNFGILYALTGFLYFYFQQVKATIRK